MRRHVLPLILSFMLPCLAKADLVISPVVTQDGNDVYVDFVVQNFTGIVSMQYTVKWDPTIMEYVSVGDFGLAGLDNNCFAIPISYPFGNLTHVWYDLTTLGITIPDCTTIYRVHFRSLNGQISDITIGDSPTAIEIAVEVNGTSVVIDLEQGTGCSNQSRVSGLIYNDTNENCQMDGEEIGMPDCQVKVEGNGQTQYVTANNKGEYYFLGPAGDYTLSAILPENVQLLPCEPTVNLSVGTNEVAELLFGANTTGGSSVSGTHELGSAQPLLQASPNPLPIGRALTVTASGPADLQLFDASGKLVRQWSQTGNGEINLGAQSGAYLLKATLKDGNSQTIKLVVY